MKNLRPAIIAALATVALCMLASHAQLPAPPATTEDALHEMLDQAAIAFTGQVTAVRRIASANGSTGVIEIDFAVDDAILGVAPNSTYTLREWAGLAPNSDSTFAVGRRYLIFLHAPGPSGLSSPVGGPDGAIPIVPGNPAASPTTPDALGLAAQTALTPSSTAANIPPATPRSPAHTNFRLPPASADAAPVSAISSASSILASSTVDLRWIATHVLTPISYADDPSLRSESATVSRDANPFSAPARSISADGKIRTTIAANSARIGATVASSTDGSNLALSAAPQPTTTANYADLLTNLRAWQRRDHTAR